MARTELLIVAHGSPSDPDPQERAMADLAERVAELLPGALVRGSTLAAPGAMEAAVADLRAPIVYPFFMAAGWFVGTRLPRRLAEMKRPDTPILPPFGTDPALPGLVLDMALSAAREAGIESADATLLLAAHGSAVSRGSARATASVAEEVARPGRFRDIRTGFVEEEPYLGAVAKEMRTPALCLPLFALRAGHVVGDVPEALEEAGFSGPLLPPVGSHAKVPALIADAVRRALRNAA